MIWFNGFKQMSRSKIHLQVERRVVKFVKTGMQHVLSVFHVSPLLCCRALKHCGSGGPPHAKLVIEWESKTKEW